MTTRKSEDAKNAKYNVVSNAIIITYTLSLNVMDSAGMVFVLILNNVILEEERDAIPTVK